MINKSVKKNYIYNLVYQILVIITPIITTPYIARKLGPSGNGIYGYTLSIVTYFVLFGSLGLNLYGQREIAYVQDDKDKRSKIFSELFVLKTITMTISLLSFYVIFCISGEYSLYFKILLLEIFANILDISWLYFGLEEFKLISFRNIIIKFLSIILILTCIKEKDDTNIYIFIHAFTTFISSISLWLNLKKYVKFDFKSMDILKHVKPIFILFIPQMATQIYAVLDKTMLGFILNDMNEIGYYEQSQKIVRILLTIITSIVTVMLPRIAKEFANNNIEKIKKYMNETFNFVFLLVYPLIFGIIIVAENFVPLFFGIGYDKVIPIMASMSIVILFIGISSIIGNQYLIPLKRNKEYTISVIAGAIINLICNVVLIHKYKSIGATIGTILAELSVVVIQLYFTKDEFDIIKLFKMSVKYFFSGTIMFIICYFVDEFIVNKVVALIAQISVGCITYFGLLILMKDKFVLYNIEIIINRIKSKIIDVKERQFK